MSSITLSTPLPPFCTTGPDRLPQGPRPGTPESMALAAWEVLTSARVARSTGSGRMSLLGAYRAEGQELTRERVIWIALHAFEGASERWGWRLARSAVMSDRELTAAVVQEMGGPAHEPDEMTTLGFWLGNVGFSFDSRGPEIELMECAHRHGRAALRRRRVGPAAILTSARRLLSIVAPAGEREHAFCSTDPEAVQLSLL